MFNLNIADCLNSWIYLRRICHHLKSVAVDVTICHEPVPFCFVSSVSSWRAGVSSRAAPDTNLPFLLTAFKKQSHTDDCCCKIRLVHDSVLEFYNRVMFIPRGFRQCILVDILYYIYFGFSCRFMTMQISFIFVLASCKRFWFIM